MVKKNDQAEDNAMDLEHVKLIADKKRILEETTYQVQKEIRSCFERLVDALKSREKLLLRQVEAVRTQRLSLVQSSPEIVTLEPDLIVDLSAKHDVEEQILSLGRLEVLGQNRIIVNDTEPYKAEEYQDSDKDHESFDKSIVCGDKDRVLVEQTNKYEVANQSGVSRSDESTLMCNDSSSYNSSLNSSSENEARSNRGNCPFASQDCTVVDYERSDETLPHGCKEDIKDPNTFPTDSTISKLKLDRDDVTDTKDSSSHGEECENVESLKNETNSDDDIDSNKEHDSSTNTALTKEFARNQNARRDSYEHPKQVQQWLQQILVETETEPMIHEIGQFSEISKARLSGQFPLET